jgi:tRNA A-37 threonylcarbamoyl transferase component Bud32
MTAPMLDLDLDLDLDIEDHNQLAEYLRRSGHVHSNGVFHATTLAGGVSNRTVLVQLSTGESWVIKQALAKLRVKADWFSDPSRIHREALGLQWFAQLAAQGNVPGLIFEDVEHHIVAMQAVPQPHENWKAMLLRGAFDLDHVRQFGELLGQCQRRAFERRDELASLFADRSFFEALRLEPYYSYTATRVNEAAPFLHALIEETLANPITLVHGDYSPKNVLVHHGHLVLLDYEVAHWGDPAFDAGFSMTHLLSKAHHVSSQRAQFARASKLFWRTYADRIGDAFGDIEPRCVRHTVACLLARVDGRSPLEYLTDGARARQRAVALTLTRDAPATIASLIDRFVDYIDSLS